MVNKFSFKRKLCAVVALFLLYGIAVSAQVISGKVSDTTGEGIPGATIMLKGTDEGTVTDVEGVYSLSLTNPATGIIVVSFIGMEQQEVAVEGRTQIDVILQDGVNQLNEVVAIGYGTVRKRDITGSVASVKGADLKQIPVASVAEAMAGKMAGVLISSTEGSPDAEVNIRIRGGGSITQDNSPLIIIDGFPVASLNDISPSDIESIDVLKDASSTAIYGSRGANGVIIVTTKSGADGKVKVSYNAFYGVKKRVQKYDVLAVDDYVDWQYEYALLDNGMDDVSSYVDYFGNYKDIDMYNGLEGNDWQEQVYGRVGKTFSHDLSIRGGTEALNYSFSYAHFGEDAIMIGSDFVRDNASLKLNSSPNDKVKLSFSVRYSDTKISGGGANEQNEKSSADSRLKHSVTYSPIPLVGLTDDGDEDVSSYLINPITSVNDNDRKQYKKNFNMAGSFAWEIVKDLKFKTEFGIENYTYNDNRFYGKTTYYVKNTPTAENQGAPAVIMRDRKQAKVRSTNTLSYDLGKYLSDAHALSFLAGQEMISATKEQMESTVHGFPEGFVSDDAFNLTSQGVPYSTSNVINPDDNLISFFSRVNYNYDGKYILTGTFRADGSSKFGEGNQWGYFPSAAVAWRLSDESFMDWSSNVLDDMKVRVSYGTAGNNNIPTGQLTQLFESKTTAYVNDVDNYWAPSKIMANPNLKWETTVSRNIGLDFAMFHSRLNGSIEVYQNNTIDLLMKFPVAGTGYDYQYRNMGETRNKGLELSLNLAVIEKEDYGLNFNFNIGFNDNEILSLGDMESFFQSSGWASTDITDDFFVNEGGSVGQMYGYQSDGRYELADFERYDEATEEWVLKSDVTDCSTVVGTLAPGMMKLRDVEGNDGIVDANDKSIIGNASPLASGGFTISGRAKGFDLSAVFSYSIGNDVYNANKIEYTTATPRYQYRNMTSDMAIGQRWTNLDKVTGQLVTDAATLEGMNANTTSWSPFMGRYVFSDWAVEDGSFLRLSTMTLGYTLPQTMVKRLKLSRLRVYATAHNVFLFTNYSGADPEVSTRRNTPLTPGVDYSAYPRSRQVVFGLNLNF